MAAPGRPAERDPTSLESDGWWAVDTLRAVFEAAPLGIAHFDHGGRVTACNPAFARVLGSARDTALGLDLRSLSDVALRGFVEAVLAGQRAYFEGELCAGGRATPVRIDFAPVVGPGGAATGGVAILEDVSDRLQAERALRRSEQAFRALTESAPDGVGVVQGGTLRYRNPALHRLLQAAGSPPASWLFDPAEAQRLQQLAEEPGDPAAHTVTTERSAPGDPSRTVEVRLCPAHFDGAPAVLIQVRDVTERRELERRLAHADRMASVGTLAAGVAHEINNPLAVIIGSVSLARHALPRLPAADAEKLQLALDTIQQSTDRVKQIVRDLTTFSRPQAEVRVPVEVEQVLDASINLAWNEIRHRARLVKRYGGVPAVEADESRLGQVFLNLLVNAVQAIPEGRPEESEIRISTHLTAGRVVIDVEDTGSGLPADPARIFEPFYTTKPLGTGLGLSICHGIVQSFGGTIRAERVPEGGTRFRVELPALEGGPGEAPPAPARAPATPSGRRRSRILVIDDEPLLGRTLRIAFSGLHDVVVAESGREALARLDEDRAFDLVLCDLMMPDVSGSAVLEHVRRHAPELAGRFAFMTGGAFTESSRSFLASWRGPCLEKPFDIHDLERILAEVDEPA